MTTNEELREIEETIAMSEAIRYEPQLLRIATEYQELLRDAANLLEDLCDGWDVWDTAQEFLARIEGEKNND